jgi:hypothetical protein
MECYYCDQIAPMSSYQVEGEWIWACAWCLLVRQGIEGFFEVSCFIARKDPHFYRTTEKFEKNWLLLSPFYIL